MMKNMKLSFAIVAVFATVIFSSKVFGLSYESEQGISFTLNPTIRITLSSNAMTISDLAPGSTSDSNIIKATIESNAVAGYTLSSTVGNNTTYNTTSMLHTNGTNTFTNLSSNKATLASFDPSTWGYSYAPCTTTECINTPSWISGDITGTTNSGYNGLPLYSTANPIKLINATTPGSSAVQFKFGAKADTAQLAGTYSNVINFIGVGKVITTSYTINYNDPSGEATSGTMPASQTGSSATGAVQISSTQPTRTNYLFKGWCTEQTSDDTCSGETVQPGGMLALHPGTTNLTPTVTRTLYAMWKDNTPKIDYCVIGSIPDSNCMQRMATCPTTATTVTDARDGEQYRVQQLADGNCWMLDNLRLGGSSAMNLTPSDTNINSNWTLPASTTTGFDSSTGYTTAAVNADYKSTITTSYGVGSGKIGNYYNYCAASGGTYCYASGSGTGDAQYDICPVGWRMPIGGSGSEYHSLCSAYDPSCKGDEYSEIEADNPSSLQYNLSTPLSGRFSNGSAGSQGDYGYFWSSTMNFGSSMRILNVASDVAYPASSSYRYYGNSLRCILDS